MVPRMSSRGRRTIGDLSRRVMRVLVLVASALFVFSLASTSHAYPWMIRHGYAKCASCHTDPMGGELLTGFGRVISDTTLSTRWDGSKDPTSRAELFFGVPEPRDLRVGGSIRYMDALYEFPHGEDKGVFSSFPMQLDTYGQVRFFEHFRFAGGLGVTKLRDEGTAFGKAAFVTKNPANEFNLLSRTHWLGWDVDDHILVRAGRMNLPFGLRIPEHVMAIRADTRTDRESEQQHGVSASYSGGRIRGEVMAVLGNYQISPDKYRERGYSLYGEYELTNGIALGISSLVTHAQVDRLGLGNDYTRQAHGVTGRFAYKQLAVLVEDDLLLASNYSTGYAAMVQADYEFVQGFHGLLTGEARDVGKTSSSIASVGQGKAQLRGWITAEWFFFTHFDARIDLVFNQDAATELLSQVHWYF
jgi:hypothetical protein